MFSRDDLLSVEEVAVSLGVSVQSINIWYRWKRQNPDNDRAKMLPEFIQLGPRQARYWEKSSLRQIEEFKNSIVMGRNGAMGSITQKYAKRKVKNDGE